MKALQRERIINHGENLNNIFSTGIDPLTLCKKLRKIEIKANKKAENYCNYGGDISFQSELKALAKILNFASQEIPVFINSDPTGYALKIDDRYIRENNIKIETDLGGYGLIAPEIN